MPLPTASYSTALATFKTEAALRQMFGPMMTDAEFVAWKNADAAPAPVVQAQRGVNPPEAGDPRTPPPVVQAQAAAPTAASAEEKAELLMSLGWSDDDLSSLTDEAFEDAAKKNLKFEDAEFDKIENAESPTGYDYTNVRKRKPAKPVWYVSPTGEWTLSPNPAQMAAEGRILVGDDAAKAAHLAAQTPAEQPVVRRRGRPPGSKNKTAQDTVAQAEAAQTEVAPEPVVEQAPVAPAPAPVVEPVTLAAGAAKDMQAVWAAKLAEHKARIVALEAQLTEAQDRVKDLEHDRVSDAAPPSAPTFTLYIDCLPEKGVAFTHLDDAIAPFCKLAAENYQDEKTGKVTPVSHYSLIPFGKGPGLVAAYVLKNIGEVARGVLVCDTRSPAAAAVLEVLRPVADVVVRGMGR